MNLTEINTYESAVSYCMAVPRFTKKNSPEDTKDFFEFLGKPGTRAKIIHIAGTNGKGSVSAFLQSICLQAGIQVGMFTSPHLCDIRERIRLNGGLISKKAFLEAFLEIERCLFTYWESFPDRKEYHPTFFELLFFISMVCFEKTNPEMIILETGLGGRLDVTNIINPVMTAITSIGLDHTDYLGDTIEAVAGEKAGIIKKSIPVIYNTGSKAADIVIENTASLLNAKAINVAKTDYIINEITHKTIDFSVHNSYYKYQKLILPVTGALYQIDNALTAIALCNELFLNETGIEQEIIQKGLDKFLWQGRMESIHPKVILDGAHNLDAIERFVESVQEISGDKDIHLLFALAGDKDYKPMIDTLCDKLRLGKVYITSINSKRGISAEHIAKIFEENFSKEQNRTCTVLWDDDIKVMLKEAFDTVKNTDNTLFCVGSLYLIGSIKEIAKEVLYD